MRLTSFGLSDLGNKRRNNEDRFLRDDRRGIFIVCDGMGGAAAGEVASGNAASLVYSELVEQGELLDGFQRGDDDSEALLSVVLETAIRHANEHVFEEGRRHADRKGMGSTLTALVVGQGRAIVGHVGDSRVYQCRGGLAQVLTDDHTWVAQEVRAGRMTDAEARTSNKQNLIMRALGVHREVLVDTKTVVALPGDKFLLCSDGLHGYFRDDDEAAGLLGRKLPLQRMVWEFIALARDRGGRDNVTAVVVDVGV